MTWQDAGVIIVVGSAVAYLVRKFLLPARPRARAATFISVQQLKSGPQPKSNSR
jgi:hypothetical protein